MRLFQAVARRAADEGISEEAAAAVLLAGMKRAESGPPVSGIASTPATRGRRGSSRWPRTRLAGVHVRIARAVERFFGESGRPLPINVDGAIAALLCDLGIPAEIGNAFFIIARVPGLVAHVHEEKTRMKPMRKIDPVDFEYDGPGERKI